MTRKNVMNSNQRVVDRYFLKLFLIPKHVSLKDEIRRNRTDYIKKNQKDELQSMFYMGDAYLNWKVNF